jgi:hypothetical protein
MNSRKMMGNCKSRGEWAELQFMAKAAKFGLRVLRPWGEMARYDMVIDNDGRLVRVQGQVDNTSEVRGLLCLRRPAL